MKGRTTIGGTDSALPTQPLAIVMIVLMLGASLYLWQQGYLRSRAALIVLAGVFAVLIYLGFFAPTGPVY